MPTYKLIYFDDQGRAEVARLVMAYGGIEYEDVRIKMEQWPEMKPNTPFGQLPVLEVDGEVICQSQAINNLLAKRAGLMGKTDIDTAKIDMINGCLSDLVKGVVAMFGESDAERKAALRKKFEDGLPADIAKLEKLLKGNFFVTNQMTLADITACYFLGFLQNKGFAINMDDYPKLKALVGKVESEKNIAAWIEKRPK